MNIAYPDKAPGKLNSFLTFLQKVFFNIQDSAKKDTKVLNLLAKLHQVKGQFWILHQSDIII